MKEGLDSKRMSEGSELERFPEEYHPHQFDDCRAWKKGRACLPMQMHVNEATHTIFEIQFGFVVGGQSDRGKNSN